MREVQRGHSPAVTWHPLETVNHVHMYTFPTTIQQKHFKQPAPIHTLSSQPSTQFTFVSHWQMVFRFLANSPLHTGMGFSNAGPFSILGRGHCDILHQLNPQCSLLILQKRSFSMFTGLSNKHIVNGGVDRKKLQLISTFNTVVWVFIHTGSRRLLVPSLFPPSLAAGTWVHLDSPSRAPVWQLTLHYVTVCTDCLICPFITVELEPALPETCFQTLFGWLGMHDAAIVELAEMGVPLQMYSGLF